MKNVKIPSWLTDLQYPWNICSHLARIKLVNQLPKNKENLDNSLKLFSLSLADLTKIPQPETDLIPKGEIENWKYVNEFIASSLSNFSDMNADIINYFIGKSRFENNSEDLKNQIFDYWIWFNVLEIIDDSSEFVKQYLELNQDQYISEKFVSIVSENWKELDCGILHDLMGKIYYARESALSFLHKIEINSVDERTRSIASDYTDLIQFQLKNNK
jgi:hypothetical protein